MPETLTIAGPKGRFGGYLARPSADRAPGVIVIQEIFGVNHVMREIADGYAARGYLALVPDLFWRIEPGIELTDRTDAEWKRAFELFNKFDVDGGVEDIAAAVACLRTLSGSDGKVGTVGYCLGGLLAYLAAARTDADASVSYYGVGIQDRLGEASAIGKPLMLHVAENDQFVPATAQEAIGRGLKANAHIVVHTYPGVDHAFARPGGQHYDRSAADLANGRTASFFARHLR